MAFRLRGLHMARIDAFSDVVFGFALTLLVVSPEVPKTYSELHASLRGFVPFAICFMLLMLIWYSHYKFFAGSEHTTWERSRSMRYCCLWCCFSSIR